MRNTQATQDALADQADSPDPIGAPNDSESQETFEVNTPETANWLVRTIQERRSYQKRVRDWAEAEVTRARKDEERLMYLFGNQLAVWADLQIKFEGGKRRSVSLPAGVVGFRRVPSRLVVDDERTVLAWAKVNCPHAVTVTETLSRSILKDHFAATGELPDRGSHVEPDSDDFYIR